MSILWSKWLLLPAIIIVIAVIITTLLCVFQDRIIFYPQSLSSKEAERITEQHGNAEEVTFQTEEGKQLHGWIVYPDGQQNEINRLLIYYGGNAEELSGQIPFISSQLEDWAILLVNYRGYGKSEGSPEEESLYNDALMVFEEIKYQFDNEPEKTVLMGRSIGTAIAVNVAAERNIDGLILVSPFDTLTKVAQHHYPFLPVSWLLRYSFDSSERINDISAPLLVISGNQDQIIPEERTQALLENKEGSFQYETVEGDHNDLHLDSRFWPAIRQFLK